MRGVVEEECALVEDRFLGLPTGALQHEFRKLLPAYSGGSVEIALASTEARIWMTSSLRRTDSDMVELIQFKHEELLRHCTDTVNTTPVTAGRNGALPRPIGTAFLEAIDVRFAGPNLVR